MLTKETAKGHSLTSTICRNLEFYQNDTKIRRKLAYENVQLLGGFIPRPLTRGSAPEPRWGPGAYLEGGPRGPRPPQSPIAQEIFALFK